MISLYLFFLPFFPFTCFLLLGFPLFVSSCLPRYYFSLFFTVPSFCSFSFLLLVFFLSFYVIAFKCDLVHLSFKTFSFCFAWRPICWIFFFVFLCSLLRSLLLLLLLLQYDFELAVELLLWLDSELGLLLLVLLCELELVVELLVELVESELELMLLTLLFWA